MYMREKKVVSVHSDWVTVIDFVHFFCHLYFFFFLCDVYITYILKILSKKD